MIWCKKIIKVPNYFGWWVWPPPTIVGRDKNWLKSLEMTNGGLGGWGKLAPKTNGRSFLIRGRHFGGKKALLHCLLVVAPWCMPPFLSFYLSLFFSLFVSSCYYVRLLLLFNHAIWCFLLCCFFSCLDATNTMYKYIVIIIFVHIHPKIPYIFERKEYIDIEQTQEWF